MAKPEKDTGKGNFVRGNGRSVENRYWGEIFKVMDEINDRRTPIGEVERKLRMLQEHFERATEMGMFGDWGDLI